MIYVIRNTQDNSIVGITTDGYAAGGNRHCRNRNILR